jgi:hypothetical protein
VRLCAHPSDLSDPLLQADQDLAGFPQLFEAVIIALLGREQVYDDVVEIDDQPALARLAFHPTVDFVLFLHLFDNCIGKSIEHPVAGAVANDKIIRKNGYVLNIQQEDILPFFLLERIDNSPGDIKRTQLSPLSKIG